MRLKKQDYQLECTTDGGFFAYLSYNMQCSAYGDTAEEALSNLQSAMDEYLDEMYLVENFA